MKKIIAIMVGVTLCFSLISSALYPFNLPNVMAISNEMFSSVNIPSIIRGLPKILSEITDNRFENQYLIKTFVDNDGRQIDEIIVPGKPPQIKEEKVSLPINEPLAGATVLSDVPAFYWSYGCSATSAAMLFGYYDNHGFSNMYTGPTNNGICPMDNSIWGQTKYPSITCGECPLSATHQGIDGRTTRGNVDDYWIDYNNAGPDPYIVNSWIEHIQGECTGDFMGTNQSKYGNSDSSTTFYFDSDGDPLYDYIGHEPRKRDGCYGLRLFAESRDYVVDSNFSQYIKGYASDPNKGFTFEDFKSEINAGRPVLIQVIGHTMLGYGYNTTGQIIYIHDTWDQADHQMTWGGQYSGLQQYAVTVIHLHPSLTITTQSLPNGTVGVSYSTTLQAIGGTGSYIWSITSGSLPLGLTLYSSTGIISGKPTTANNFSFTVQVTDSTETVTANFSIIINPPPTLTTISPDGTQVYLPTSTIHVTWDVEGFTGTEGKVRVFFFNGLTWEIVASNLDLADGSFDIDLSTKTIADPLRCRVRTGIYDPDTGFWLTWGTSGQYYDESGHFWVIDLHVE